MHPQSTRSRSCHHCERICERVRKCGRLAPVAAEQWPLLRHALQLMRPMALWTRRKRMFMAMKREVYAWWYARRSSISPDAGTESMADAVIRRPGLHDKSVGPANRVDIKA